MDSSLALADDDASVDLAEEICRSRDVFPSVRRARQSWTLSKAGRVAPLEALWEELDDADPTAGTARYEVSLGLARSGRTEHLEAIRRRWLDEWDLRAVEVLERHGEERDIPDLEAAKGRGAPGFVVDAAIDAIRSRARGSGSG